MAWAISLAGDADLSTDCPSGIIVQELHLALGDEPPRGNGSIKYVIGSA